MRLKFIIFFLAVTNFISAQLIYDKSTLLLKVNATSFIDFLTFPSVQLSVEKKITRNFSLSTEFGYQLYDFGYNDSVFLSPGGFKLNFESRFYAPKFLKQGLPVILKNIYIGLRPFYRQNQYNASTSYQTKLDSLDWHKDDFGVKNTTYGLYTVFGYQNSISRKLVVDVYTGLGIMKRMVRNTNIEYNKDSGDILAGTDFMRFFETLDLSESSGIYGNFLIGFRIGYKLK